MPTEDIQDATLALKGILGISHPTKTAPAPVSRRRTDNKKKGKDRDRDKDKDGNRRDRNNSYNTLPKSDMNRSGGKKKKKGGNSSGNGESQTKSYPRGKKKNQNTSPNSKTKEIFAWSAFQSPPDASNLPLPSFGDGKGDNDKDEGQDRGEGDSGYVVGQQGEAIEIDEGDALRMANVKLSNTIASEDDIKALLNIKGNPQQTEGIADNGNSHEKQSQVVESACGVNLATLALKDTTTSSRKIHETVALKQSNPVSDDKSDTKNSKQSEEENDPLMSLMNPYGSGRNANDNPMSPYQTNSPHHYHHHDSHPYSMQTHAASQQPPNAYALPHVHPMMQQPYITLQVQVPSELLPGRQMMVYNVPVVVPEGVQPGMVIPVTVPNPSLYGQNPMMHSHSPTMRYGQVGQQVGQYSQVQQQLFAQQQQQQQQQQVGGSPGRQPPPGSWAAKAAAQPRK